MRSMDPPLPTSFRHMYTHTRVSAAENCNNFERLWKVCPLQAKPPCRQPPKRSRKRRQLNLQKRKSARSAKQFFLMA